MPVIGPFTFWVFFVHGNYEEDIFLKKRLLKYQLNFFTDFNILVSILFGAVNLLIFKWDMAEKNSSASVGVIIKYIYIFTNKVVSVTFLWEPYFCLRFFSNCCQIIIESISYFDRINNHFCTEIYENRWN